MAPLSDLPLPLTPWQSFYAIVGASAGALIGLQFVVITLVVGMRDKASEEAINAFGSPTVVHFSGSLAISAIMSAPWPSELATALAIGLCGLSGLIYEGIVLSRTRRQKTYEPVLEDCCCWGPEEEWKGRDTTTVEMACLKINCS